MKRLLISTKKKKREFWGALINHGDVVCTHRFSSHSLVLGENQVSVITNKQNRKEYGFDSERSTMKNDHNNNNNNSAEHSKDTTVGILDSRFNQTLRNVQGLLKGRNIPGKILLSQRVESPDYTSLSSPTYIRSSSYSETGTSDQTSETEEVHSTSKPFGIPNDNKLKISASNVESSSEEVRKSSMGARATDSARVMKFTKALSETMVKLEKLREFSWSGVPDYMRPTVWRLLLGYAPPNSDRREGVLKRSALSILTVFLSIMIFLIQNARMMRSICFARLLLIVQELYLKFHSFNNSKFRNHWSVFCTHGPFGILQVDMFRG
uniref:Rab-GAP TBC domain-containing protein n=1 Tax=Glycine max TaxID=3847 RepID=C6TMM1_SOYBN|nr:unknown [Glycine max]